MELTFVSSNALGKTEAWECEFEVTSDFNCHIERKKGGTIIFYQRTSTEGGYANIEDVGYQESKPVIDLDFSGVIYPKHIKIVSESEPTMAVVTFNA